MSDSNVITTHESEVRSYCRSFPDVFDRAEGVELFSADGRAYLDFFSGAGALNYGHNPPEMIRALLRYIERGGITHGLDMATRAKAEFIDRFVDVVLRPRGLEYKLQFPGPTGTNAVESALKLARKITGRETVVSFTNAFHGMTLGSLSVTGNGFKRRGAGLPLLHTSCMPYDGYLGEDADTIAYMEAFLTDDGSGVDLPAAVIVETIQAEGGVNVASAEWLRRLGELCQAQNILLIVDDIQVGCGRTGPFFSFERAGLRPDMICLSKSLRGNNHAFVTATAALGYWQDDRLSSEVKRKGALVREVLQGMADESGLDDAEVRGLGLIQGLDCRTPGLAADVCRRAFDRGLVIETSGPESTVLKVLPPLIIDDADLRRGFAILAESLDDVLRDRTEVAIAVAGVETQVEP